MSQSDYHKFGYVLRPLFPLPWRIAFSIALTYREPNFVYCYRSVQRLFRKVQSLAGIVQQYPQIVFFKRCILLTHIYHILINPHCFRQRCSDSCECWFNSGVAKSSTILFLVVNAKVRNFRDWGKVVLRLFQISAGC